jgi:multidrug transporter EmrE-like cation transporter
MNYVMNSQAPTSRFASFSYAALLTSIAFGITGQLFMKYTMSSKTDSLLTETFLLHIALALTIHSLGVVSWIFALRSIKLSVAYPLTSLNYIGILFGSYYFFGERITSTRIAGVFLIFLGVLLVTVPIKRVRFSQNNK